MALPTPNTDERREEYINRCMSSDAVQEEYPDIDSRTSACHAQFTANEGTGKHNVSILLDNVADVRRDTMDGVEYMVAPVVLLTEGVHVGSGGPMYYPADVLAQFPAAWNGRPVPVLHPYSEDGTPISCNTPEVLERQSVGQLFNVVWDAPKLRGEVWVNIAKARRLSPEILETIPNGQMEVSTGLLSNDFMMPGIWNEEEYMGVVQSIRPDHLALLPGGRGACSWDDGCGIRANEEDREQVQVLLWRPKDVTLSDKFQAQLQKVVDNELSHDDLHHKLQKLADERDNDFFIHYIDEVFDTYIIMRVHTATGQMLLKMDYSVDEAENVSLSGEPTQVRRVVTYQPINPGTIPQAIPGLQNQKTGGSKMAKKKENEDKGACCKEAIDAMISNEASTYVEDDRKWLEEMPEDQIKRLAENLPVVDADGGAGNATETAADAGDDTAGDDTADADATLNAEKKDTTTLTALLEGAEPAQKDLFSEMQAVYDEKKTGLIETIIGNSANTFTKDDLKVKDMKELEGLAALASSGKKAPRDYSLQGAGTGVKVHTGEAPLVAPSYLDKKKKEDK